MTTDSLHARDEIEEAAAAWIARRDGGEWSAVDATSLQAWLAESADHRVAYYRLNAAWMQAGRLGAARQSARRRLFAVAASVLVLLAVTVSVETGLFRSAPQVPSPAARSNEAPSVESVSPSADSPVEEAASAVTPAAPSRQRHATAIGDLRTVLLPDGSRVTLDTNSEIRVAMDTRSRTIQLDRGQAFFEVTHDRQRPFVVNADRVRVIAVGTQFAVRRVAADIRVVVAEGSVRLEGRELLSAGGIARVEGDEVQIRQGALTDVERDLSWRSGVLTFRHTSLSDAVAEFNRYGTRAIIIRDQSIATLELGGVFRSNDVEAFLHLLGRTFPVEVLSHPDRIELTARREP